MNGVSDTYQWRTVCHNIKVLIKFCKLRSCKGTVYSSASSVNDEHAVVAMSPIKHVAAIEYCLSLSHTCWKASQERRGMEAQAALAQAAADEQIRHAAETAHAERMKQEEVRCTLKILSGTGCLHAPCIHLVFAFERPQTCQQNAGMQGHLLCGLSSSLAHPDLHLVKSACG